MVATNIQIVNKLNDSLQEVICDADKKAVCKFSK